MQAYRFIIYWKMTKTIEKNTGEGNDRECWDRRLHVYF
jgi:hypothetical protein